MNLSRGLSIISLALLIVFAATNVFAGVPLVTSYQGRLLDGADKPLTGSYTMVFQIYDVPSGGAPLWTEDHVGVSVTDGLFTVALGATVPLSAELLAGSGGGGGGAGGFRYLQIQVSGQPPISPRTPLSSAPSAVVSSSVSGDIKTAPGLVVMGDSLTDYYATFGEKVNQGLHAAGGALASGATRITNDCDGTSATQVMEKKGLNAVNVKLARMISRPPSGPAAADSIDLDSDNDGVMDRSISSSCDATGAKHAITTKGTGSAGRTVRSMTDSLVAASSVEADLDGDGTPENFSIQVANADSVYHEVSVSDPLPGGGVALMKAKEKANRTKCSSNLRYQSPSSSSGKDDDCDGFSASRHLFFDSDGDGVPETDLQEVCLPTTSGVAIKTKGTGADANKTASLTVSGSPGGNVSSIGVADTDGDGTNDEEISQIITPTTSGVAIQTKGTGADKNRTASVSSTTGFLSASTASVVDDDGDGVPESEITQILTPTTSGVAIKTKGTGADNNRAANLVCAADLDGDGTVDRSVSTTADSTTAGIAIDEPGVQIAMKVVNHGTVKGNINIMNGSRMVDFDSDGNGFFAGKVGIGVDVPTHSVDVSGGAYCDGTNWVNASDASVKENFQPVNGSELLDQIEQLAISKWNYKGNTEMAHIGPTAQDFQAAFGVGSDGKSISTIDPAGIALAAAKELRVELKDKTQQLDELQNKVQQLQALVERLLAEKK